MSHTAAIAISLALVILWLGFTAWCMRRVFSQKKTTTKQQTFIAYASQGGRAQNLAEELQALLGKNEHALVTLNNLDNNTLKHCTRLLIIASTYGDGEAPDNGAIFYKRFIANNSLLDLSYLSFAVLALGDKSYRHFCGFGQQVDDYFQRCGAKRLCNMRRLQPWEIGDPQHALKNWLANAPDIHFKKTNTNQNAFSDLQLSSRTIANPNSQSAALFDIRLGGKTPLPYWQAGDIVEIQPQNSPARIKVWCEAASQANLKQPVNEYLSDKDLRHSSHDEQLKSLPTREYSIASLPEENTLRLLVREQKNATGELGLGSGFLGKHLRIGQSLRARVRPNPNFHAPEAKAPLILIGAGSGLAGLRAHIAWRATQSHAAKCWLIYGERSEQHDRIWQDELNDWQNRGVLTDISLSFSRASTPQYVQDILNAHAVQLKQWVADGAFIYICGRLQGMGEGVHNALQKVLGNNELDKLIESGRYRRDLY